VRAKAEEYGVSPVAMSAIINCESQWNYTIQSQHTYHEKNVPNGYQVGDREQSYGLVQIHLPAHPHIKKEDAINPEFAIDFLAKNLKAGRAGMWTCAKTLALI
jgi:Transglycosylase SLT domain